MKTIIVRVKTNSSKNEVLSRGDIWKVALKAVPEKGKANKELVKFLHKKFKKRVSIVSGLKSKEKIIKLE